MSSWIGAPLDREALRAEAEAREHFEKLDAEQDAGTQFLTDIEAGKMVKRNSETIARWRRGEGLRFVPGRPCLIERKDLLAFWKRVNARSINNLGSPLGRSQRRAMPHPKNWHGFATRRCGG